MKEFKSKEEREEREGARDRTKNTLWMKLHSGTIALIVAPSLNSFWTFYYAMPKIFKIQ